jgi:hypothetical protein
MSPPDDVRLGPLTRAVLNCAVSREESSFPASQVWADEVERVLSFLQVQSVFKVFLPRLRSREWEGALAEARAGFFLHRNGFRILGWEPVAVPNHPGDIEVQWRDTEPIFVEVKGPGWEGELSVEEIRAGRKRLPRYINAEARVIDPTQRVLYTIGKALPKLAQHRANLVVVVDHWFVSPVELPRDRLVGRIVRGLADPAMCTVAGVLLLNPVDHSGFVEYRKCYVPNNLAGHPLPEPVHLGFITGNSDPQGPR